MIRSTQKNWHRLALAAALFALCLATPSLADGIVSPMAWIAPDVPPGDSSDRIANTSFVQQGFTSSAANNAAIKALPTVHATSVARLGFSAPGDAPPVTYTFNTSACSLNSGAGDNGSQIAPNSGTGCWIASLPTPAPFTIWGADSTGTAYSNVAVQAALNSGVCNLIFPKGTFRLAPGLTVTVPCEIRSAPGATITTDVATGDLFLISGTSFFTGAITNIRNLTITSSVVRTGGAYIHCTSVCNIWNPNFFKHAIGIDIDGATQSLIFGGNYRNATPESAYANSTHIWVHGAADSVNIISPTSFTDSQVAADQPRSCLHVESADALIVANPDLILCRSVMLVDPGAGETVLSTQLNGGFLDTPMGSTGAALEITTKGGAVARFTATGTAIGDAVGGSDIVLNVTGTTGGLNTFICNACMLLGNGVNVYGVDIRSQFVHDVQFTGGCIASNGTANVHSVAGPTDIRFIGVGHGDPGQSCAGPISPTGFIVDGVVGRWDISHNDLSGPAAKITGLSFLQNSFVSDNIGLNPIGSSTVTVGASPFTHCAGATPETDYIAGGTVTSIITQTSVTGLTSGAFALGANECIGISYTVAPFLTVSVH